MFKISVFRHLIEILLHLFKSFMMISPSILFKEHLLIFHFLLESSHLDLLLISDLTLKLSSFNFADTLLDPLYLVLLVFTNILNVWSNRVLV